MRLRPVHDGAFTHWCIRGSVVTAVPRRDMNVLLAKLSLWSGWPVEVVLPVDIETAAWLARWVEECLADIPEDHARLRFVRALGHSREK